LQAYKAQKHTQFSDWSQIQLSLMTSWSLHCIDTAVSQYQSKITLRPRRQQTCAAVFSCHDLDHGPMTLKLDRDIDILQTKKEVARSSHSKDK